MKIVKMSLAAAVAVAGLSSSTLAGDFDRLAVSAKAEIEYHSVTVGDDSANGFTDGEYNLKTVYSSKDGKGKLTARFRANSSSSGKNDVAVKLNKLYVDYTLPAGIGLRVATKAKLLGNFSNAYYDSGIQVSKKVSGFNVNFAIIKDSREKVALNTAGKVAMLDIKVDYVSGSKDGYLATYTAGKFGPAVVGFGYAAGSGDDNEDNSLVGFDASYKVAGDVEIVAAYTIAGDNGGSVAAGGGDSLPKALGDFGSEQFDGGADAPTSGAETAAYSIGASKTISGVTVLASYSGSTSDVDGIEDQSELFLSAKYSLNDQTTLEASFSTYDDGGDDTRDDIGLTFVSKF